MSFPNEDLIKLINNKSPGFSKSQRLIAGFITEHYEKAAYMTALKLGNAVGTSESTVVRFAIELGFEGYPEFQKSLQTYIKNRLTAVQRIEITNERIDKNNVLAGVLNQDINRIRATIELSDENIFKEAVNRIISSEKIYIFGAMSSNMLAMFLYYYFQLIFDNVIYVKPINTSGIYQQFLRISEKDTLISISFPRYSKSALNAASYAKSCGANITAITDSRLSPLAELADQLLLAKSDMASFADSLVAPLGVINALIVAVGIEKQTEIEKNLTRLEQLWEENDVYKRD